MLMLRKTSLTIIVTHNSEAFLQNCLSSISSQDTDIVVVDNNSKRKSYLKHPDVKFHFLDENVGFAKANNIAFKTYAAEYEYVCFLNPDAFPNESVYLRASNYMEKNKNVGIYSGYLYQYDIHSNAPLHKYDSTGIYSTWYGRWYDNFQGIPIQKNIEVKEKHSPEAVCGAFMFCRVKAIKDVLVDGDQVFNEKFYMYKEDIELCLRMKLAGYSLILDPEAKIFHCRGWRERVKMPFSSKYHSAKNDLRISWRYRPQYLAFAFFKYVYVLLIEEK